MKSTAALALCSLFLTFALVGVVHAADENFGVQFLGNPLLILAIVIILAVSASLYHRIKK